MVNGLLFIKFYVLLCLTISGYSQQEDFTQIILNKMGYTDQESIIPYEDLKLAIKRIISHDKLNPENDKFYEAVIARLLRNEDVNSFQVKDVPPLFHGDNLQIALSYVIHNQEENFKNEGEDSVEEDEDSYHNRKRKKEQRRKKSDL